VGWSILFPLLPPTKRICFIRRLFVYLFVCLLATSHKNYRILIESSWKFCQRSCPGSSFLTPRAISRFRRKPRQRGRKIHGVGKIEIFNWNRRLSRCWNFWKYFYHGIGEIRRILLSQIDKKLSTDSYEIFLRSGMSHFHFGADPDHDPDPWIFIISVVRILRDLRLWRSFCALRMLLYYSWVEVLQLLWHCWLGNRRDPPAWKKNLAPVMFFFEDHVGDWVSNLQ